LMNFGASHAKGEAILFLNESLEVISSDWLEEMAGWVQQNEVGAIGAKLLNQDKTIMHAGLVIGLDGIVGSPFAEAYEGCWGPFGYDGWYRDYLAVSCDCLMVRRELFEEVAGFNKEITFHNDAELCVRLWEKGYRIVYTPFAKLSFHSTNDRQRCESPQDLKILYKKFKLFLERVDPYYNINLSQWCTIPAIKTPEERKMTEYIQEIIGEQ